MTGVVAIKGYGHYASKIDAYLRLPLLAGICFVAAAFVVWIVGRAKHET